MTFYCDVKFVDSRSPIERMEFPRCPVIGDELVVLSHGVNLNTFQVTKVRFMNNYDSNQIHDTIIYVKKITDGLKP